jgi:hypothetical protein
MRQGPPDEFDAFVVAKSRRRCWCFEQRQLPDEPVTHIAVHAAIMHVLGNARTAVRMRVLPSLIA